VLLVDEYRHIGDRVPLGLARNATDELLANPGGGDGVPELPEAPTASENDAALADLMSKIGGLSG
jgi:hypothetical protein